MDSTTIKMDEKSSVTKQPRFSGISHVSLPCRDLQESKRFYTEVMGGELVPRNRRILRSSNCERHHRSIRAAGRLAWTRRRISALCFFCRGREFSPDGRLASP